MTGGEQQRRASSAGIWSARLVWFAIPLLLAYFAIPRFTSGVAVEAAFPVPVYMTMNVRLPRSAYAAAADALADADRDDGAAMIARAEAMNHAGMPVEGTLPVLRQGLSRAPASSVGWTLMAELRHGRRAKAGVALGLALSLGPYDYWLAGRRAKDAVELWDALAPDDRAAALRQLQLLWDEPTLRSTIPPLLQLKDAPGLLTRALASEPDEVRALNRWVAARQRRELRLK